MSIIDPARTSACARHKVFACPKCYPDLGENEAVPSREELVKCPECGAPCKRTQWADLSPGYIYKKE